MVYISILLNLKVKKINSLQFFMLLRATREFFFLMQLIRLPTRHFLTKNILIF